MDSETGPPGVQPPLRIGRSLIPATPNLRHGSLPTPLCTHHPLSQIPPPLPVTGDGFKCTSPRCRDKDPYANSAGYVQHLNQQHGGEMAQSFRVINRLSDLVNCRDCGHFCLNARGLTSHQRRKHNRSSLPSVAGQPAPAEAPPPPDPDPAPPDILEAGLELSDEELLDLFQRPLYDIHRAWRAPLFRIIRRLSQGILEGPPAVEVKCTLAFLLLPGLVAECHHGKWIPIGALLAHLAGGVDLARSDDDYAEMVLAQARKAVPRIQAYRIRAAERRRDAPAMDHSMVAQLLRQIERLLRERRLRLANRLIDQFNLALQTGSVAPALALTLEGVKAQVAQLFPAASARDSFSDAQVQLAHDTEPLILPPGYIGSILPSLSRGSGSGISGWTNAFILDVFVGGTEKRDTGVNLLTDLCNKMLAGQMQSHLWLLSRLVLIPKPADTATIPPLTPSPPSVTLRPLGLPEIFYRLVGRAAVRVEASSVGPTMEPVQLGVGIPFGCQIGAKGAQCAFDARKAVSTWDGINAFNTEPRQDTFAGVAERAPRLLRYYTWGYGQPTPLLWRGQLVGWSGTGVKQGDPAGPLFYAVSTYPLFCSIRDAVDRVVNEYFPLMPSYTGVSAICDDLQVTCDPQLILPVSEVVQRKYRESGRGLNLAKCRILVHPDSVHLVVWPQRWRPGLCATIPIETVGAKLLGAPIGTEPFRMEFVEKRVSKATASIAALERLPPSATWTVVRFCINERVNYLAQVTEFPLVQESLALMDTIIDHALLRAGGLPLEPPDPLTHLTTLTLRSLPTELGGLGIRRYSGLAGEIACLRGRTVFYEFAERFAPELLAGATEDYWPPIVLGAAENAVWTEVAGLFREDSEEDVPAEPPPTYNIAGMFRAYYLATGESSPLYGFTNPSHTAAERRSDRLHMRTGEVDIKAAGRKITGIRFDALVQLLHSRGRLAESCLLKSNRFPRSGCWLAGPGGYLSGCTTLNPAEYRMALRLRLLRSPASLDVGDAEGGVLCRCNRRVSLVDDPFHCFHCPSSQGQFIRRHNHIRDALIDQIGDALRPENGPYDVQVECEPLVRAHPAPAQGPPPLPLGDAMEVEADTTDRFADDSDDIEFIEDLQRPYHPQMSILDLRQRNATDKAAGQCRGDVGLYVDGSRLLLDVAAADATAPSYRKPPPRPPAPPPVEPLDPQTGAPGAPTASRRKLKRRRRRAPAGQDSSHPRLPGQSYAIEHRVGEKKTKFRPFLGADVDDPRRFVPFVLEASGRLGDEAGAFLDHLRTFCSFPLLRFRALVSVISAQHNARMALRWVRYLRHPI